MKNNVHVPKTAGIAVGVLVVLVAVGFVLKGTFFARASDAAPRDVIISNITANSARVTWSTGSSTQGVIEYGVSATAMNFFAPETAAALQHSVDLTLLSPATTYYFRIRVSDKAYDNAGVPWTFTTKAKADTTQTNGTGLVSVTPPVDTISSLPTVQVTATQPISVTPAPPITGGGVTTCTYTDCNLIKENFGKGCSTQDYVRCIMKNK